MTEAGAEGAEAVVEKGRRVEGVRVKALPKPDREAFDAECARHVGAQEAHTARLAALDAQIKERNASRKTSASSSETGGSRARLAELNAAFKRALDEKNAMRDELAAHDASRNAQREELKAARGALKFRSVEDINAEVSRLERLIEHTTMPLNEEKRVLTQIKELGRSRAEVTATADKSAKLAGGEDGRKELVERLKAKDTEINAVKAERSGVQAALAAVRAKDEAAVADLPALQEERNKVWEALSASRQALRKHKEAHKAAEEGWWANEKLWRAQERETKQKRWEEGQAERKARLEAKRKYDEENTPPPYSDEVLICEQLGTYLSVWAPEQPPACDPGALSSAVGAPSHTPAPTGPRRAPSAPATSVLVGKKGKDEGAAEKYAVAPKKGGAAPKQHQAAPSSATAGAPHTPAAAAAAAPVAAKTRPPGERLVHSLDALASFARVGLVAPPTARDVPRAKADVTAKKARYLELRAATLAKKAAREAAHAAALAEGKAYTPPPPDDALVSVRLALDDAAQRVRLDLCVL